MESRIAVSRLGAIEKLTVGYSHRRDFTIADECSGDSLNYTWVYEETLCLERATQTLSIARRWSKNADVRTLYHIEGGVSTLLDACIWYFVDWPGVDDISDAARYCEITLEHQNGARRTLRLPYSRAALPDGWEEFLDSVRELISPYGGSELLDPAMRARGVRPGEYIYCSVSFQPFGKTYYYRTDDDTLRPGDWVVVPAGPENRERRVRVEMVEYFRGDELPMPLARVKHILRRSGKPSNG